jgi:ACS family D-galactonate transporter-like MFS transporter
MSGCVRVGAAVPIMRELGLSPRQYGALGSSFFLLFSISGILVGFAANRHSTRRIILLLGLVWALVQFPMAGTVSFATLLICRGPAGRRRGTGRLGRAASAGSPGCC